MKPLFIFLGILLAGILGYKYEPSLRYQLTGLKPGEKPVKEQSSKGNDQAAAKQSKSGDNPGTGQAGTPSDQVPVDPAKLTADQLPEKVMLNTDVKVTDPSADLTMTIQAGNKVKLLRIEGSNAVVSPGAGPYTGTIPIANTDLMAQLAANPPAPAATATDPATTVPTTTDPAMTPPATDPAVTPPATDPAVTPPATDPATTPPATDPAATPPATDPAATPATTPVPATDPTVTPTPDPAATTPPAPATDPAAVATPTPTPTPAPAPATVPAAPRATGVAGIVPIMQASIRSGQIKEFTFPEVLSWKAEANETVDGEVFQTGTVTYKAETTFGVKTLQAKAYIKNGKVQRWIWLKSGVEIK